MVGMRNFEDTRHTHKGSFICSFSISMPVPLKPLFIKRIPACTILNISITLTKMEI